MNLKALVKRAFLFFGFEISRAVRGVHALSQTDKDTLPFLERPTPEGKFIVTTQLFDQISDEALSQFDRFLENNPEIKSQITDVPQEHYRREVLRLGNYYLRQLFNQDTGLSPFSPPDSVHAMVRESIYCGDMYYCDLITEALDDIGHTIKSQMHILDFGCSSGRIIKTMSAAYPDAHFSGCDPNRKAIEWAAREFPESIFFVSPEVPPISAPDGCYDYIYAISIWSHFSNNAALEWFREINRVIKKGGVFLFTAHGFGSLKYYLDNAVMAKGQVEIARTELQNRGNFFLDVFGPDGDWGVGKSNWGQSFFNPSYLISKLIEDWNIVVFKPRQVESNQDLYGLQKK